MAEFDGEKLLKTLVKMEQEVSKYYTQMANSITDERSKNIFTRLSAEEDRHEKMYNALLEKYNGNMKKDFSEDDIEYAKLLIDSNVMVKHEFDSKKPFKEVLEIAEKMEKDGIIFVENLKSMYPEVATKEIDIVLKEEKKHLKLVLERKYAAVIPGLGL